MISIRTTFSRRSIFGAAAVPVATVATAVSAAAMPLPTREQMIEKLMTEGRKLSRDWAEGQVDTLITLGLLKVTDH